MKVLWSAYFRLKFIFIALLYYSIDFSSNSFLKDLPKNQPNEPKFDNHCKMIWCTMKLFYSGSIDMNFIGFKYLFFHFRISRFPSKSSSQSEHRLGISIRRYHFKWISFVLLPRETTEQLSHTGQRSVSRKWNLIFGAPRSFSKRNIPIKLCL